jgi:hypothetical protein
MIKGKVGTRCNWHWIYQITVKSNQVLLVSRACIMAKCMGFLTPDHWLTYNIWLELMKARERGKPYIYSPIYTQLVYKLQRTAFSVQCSNTLWREVT